MCMAESLSNKIGVSLKNRERKKKKQILNFTLEKDINFILPPIKSKQKRSIKGSQDLLGWPSV